MRLHVYTIVLNLFMCDVQLKIFHILYACETRRSFHQVNVSNRNGRGGGAVGRSGPASGRLGVRESQPQQT